MGEYKKSLKAHKKALADYAREQAEFEAQEKQRLAEEQAAIEEATRIQEQIKRDEDRKYKELIRQRELENQKALNAPKTQLPPDAVENIAVNKVEDFALNEPVKTPVVQNSGVRGRGGKFRGKGKFRGEVIEGRRREDKKGARRSREKTIERVG